MNPIRFAMRRPITTLLLVVVLASGTVFGLSEAGVVNLGPENRAYLQKIGASAKHAKGYVVTKYTEYFHKKHEEHHEAHHKVVVTSPESKSVTITQQYVCQIHSQKHINVRALENGYLKSISIKEGQAVKQDDVLFEIVPILYKTRFDSESAEAEIARLKWAQAEKLHRDKVVSEQDVKLHEAEYNKANAKAQMAKAELEFAKLKAPFDGIVDRLLEREGSLVEEGDILTTLSDNSLMWVYFNVPEADYLEYMEALGENKEDRKVELILANGHKFSQDGIIGAIEAKFNNETGNIPFRADFQNPQRLLRHGQTGTVLLHRIVTDAVVIPQRAVFEILDKRFVFVVDKDGMVHQREILPQYEMDDIFVIKKGLAVGDRIVLEGIREVHDGEKVEFEFRPPQQVLAALKNRAE
ncbi:efflux RND transporter periplasmic adaptor subunit [Singulisphaera rosea]